MTTRLATRSKQCAQSSVDAVVQRLRDELAFASSRDHHITAVVFVQRGWFPFFYHYSFFHDHRRTAFFLNCPEQFCCRPAFLFNPPTNFTAPVMTSSIAAVPYFDAFDSSHKSAATVRFPAIYLVGDGDHHVCRSSLYLRSFLRSCCPLFSSALSGSFHSSPSNVPHRIITSRAKSSSSAPNSVNTPVPYCSASGLVAWVV
jgi:hypothetical protein